MLIMLADAKPRCIAPQIIFDQIGCTEHVRIEATHCIIHSSAVPASYIAPVPVLMCILTKPTLQSCLNQLLASSGTEHFSLADCQQTGGQGMGHVKTVNI